MVIAKKSAKLTMELIGKRFQETWNRHDAAGLAALYSPSGAVHDPLHSAPLRGREAIIKATQDMWRAFPDAHIRFTSAITEGQSGAMEMVITGTHRAPLVGHKVAIGATNKRVEIRGCEVFRWNGEGLITEHHRYYDTSSIVRQMGIGA